MAVEAKICGLTNPADALLAVTHGAAALGVVFAGGPRRVTTGQAREIVAVAGAVPVIGVFGAQAPKEILATAAACGLRGVQLHREATEAERVALREAGLLVWQMHPVGGPMTAAPLASPTVDLWLLEPWHPAGGGGRGVPGDLQAAQRVRGQLAGAPVGLAGGLTPTSVAHAITVVRPDLVDVSSGIEQSPGIKDPARLIHFLEMVRNAGLAS